MTRLDRLAAEYGVRAEDLILWVERRWVLPSSGGSELFFTETDRARIRMIVEFQRDLAIDEEAMPVVLNLVDRLHAARAQIRLVLEGVAALPSAQRDIVLRRLEEAP